MFPSPRVAVVVPLYRESLTREERISLRHLETYLAAYDRIAVGPRGLRVPREGFRFLPFSPRYFRSRADYSRLLLSDGFYRRFEAYEFILVHQLDALVFRDELPRWCARDYDYVGAPWLAGSALGRQGVGNGGLSLRRVARFREVLRRARFGGRAAGAPPRIPSASGSYGAGRALWDRVRRFFRPQAGYACEDLFWSFEARRWLPSFSVPDADTALRFSFEENPRACLRRTGGALPFGCHGWDRYDPDFWRPYLLCP